MEQVRSTSRGGFSVRSIFSFVLAALIAALLATSLLPLKAHAQSLNGNWNGESILIDNRQFFPIDEAKAGTGHGITPGSALYMSIDEPEGSAAVRKAFVLFFSPGVDPPTATSATYATYDLSKDNVFSNQSNRQDVTMTPYGQSTSYGSSCALSGGVSWMICQVTVSLANAMDWIFEQVVRFVATPPVAVNDSTSSLYTAWNVMRSIANVAFIIAFLIIIYSQLTGGGFSNYTLKKLLPRLVVAAVLVNISFFVCALAVDLSNILGYSLQNLLITIRENTFALTDQNGGAATSSWSAVAAYVLSGGAAVGGFMGLAAATGGSLASAVYLVLPILAAGALTVLVVLVILAARQAIIIIMIVVAPLAFVANLLPNTEKWFDKWKDLFMTMLIFFPGFSLVFGGSQLAGGIIIQNASNFVMIIFGMAVQVAPLVITPLLLKLSGGLLGKIAGIVNNPSKGLLDRTRNSSKERAAMHRGRVMGQTDTGRKNPFRATARRLDAGKRNLKKASEIYEQQIETRYMDKDKRYAELHEMDHDAGRERKLVEGRHDLHEQSRIRSSPDVLRKEMQIRTLATEANSQKEQVNRIAEGLNNGTDVSATGNLADLAARSQVATRDIALAGIAVQLGKRVQQSQLSEALLKNQAKVDGQTLQQWAGALDKDNGAEAALTYAVNLKRKADSEQIAERGALMKHFKFASAQYSELAYGRDVSIKDSAGQVIHTFKGSDDYTHEAALDTALKIGTVKELIDLMASSGEGQVNYNFRDTISEAIPANGMPGKATFMAGRFINEVKLGNVKSRDDIVGWAAESILGGKIKAEDLANNDADAVQVFIEAAQLGEARYAGDPEKLSKFRKNRASMQQKARSILDPHTTVGQNASEGTQDALKALRDLYPLPPEPTDDEA